MEVKGAAPNVQCKIATCDGACLWGKMHLGKADSKV